MTTTEVEAQEIDHAGFR